MPVPAPALAPPDRPSSPPPSPRRSSRGAAALLVLALLGAAAVTLRPVGDGWAWGAPAEEIAWYLGGLGSPATLRQLLGNLLFLAPAAVAAVHAAPRLLGARRAGTRRLVVAAASVAVGIEVLQWSLSLGRVVSPTDAVLNTVGAVLAGLAARHALGDARPVEEASTVAR